MSFVLRLILLTVTAVGSVHALRRFVLVPCRCNAHIRQGVTRETTAFSLPAGSFAALEMSRRDIEQLGPCVANDPSNIGADMVLASAYRLLGKREKAIGLYQLALRYDQRPELYFNLGQVQLESGDEKAAVQNFITACLYDHAYFDEIGEQKTEVMDAVQKYLQEHINRPR